MLQLIMDCTMPILLIPMELHDQLESLTRRYTYMHFTPRDPYYYWDAEPILSQGLWGSPDRGGIYKNKNKRTFRTFKRSIVFTRILSTYEHIDIYFGAYKYYNLYYPTCRSLSL